MPQIVNVDLGDQIPIVAVGPPIDPEVDRLATRRHDIGQEWRILCFQDAFQNAEQPPWLIKDLLMSETVTLVSAQPHGMKSLSWLYACLEGVERQQVFGHFPAPDLMNAFYIETEDPEWLVKKRVQGFALGLGLNPGESSSRLPLRVSRSFWPHEGTLPKWRKKSMSLTSI